MSEDDYSPEAQARHARVLFDNLEPDEINQLTLEPLLEMGLDLTDLFAEFGMDWSDPETWDERKFKVEGEE